MKTVIVTGSVQWDDPVFMQNKLVEADCNLLVHGGAMGADSMADEWAKYHGIERDIIRANWNKYGRAAGPIRNRKMLEKYKNKENVIVMAFRKNMSRGTTNTIETAKELGMKVVVYDRSGE